MRSVAILASILQLGLCCAPAFTPYFDGWCQSRESHKDDGPYFDVKTAQKICARDNANLISFHSRERNDLYANGWDGLMIGVTCSNRTSRFEWTDGTRMDFTNFADSKYADPNYVCNVTESFMLDKAGKWIPFVPLWDDYYHEDDSYYLCIGRRLIDTPCDEYNVMTSSVGDQCYVLGQWQWSANEAEESCWYIHNDPPTKLISIHDDQSNAFFRRYLASNIFQSVEGAYIGLRRAANGTFYWTDGSPVAYTNLANPAAAPTDEETCYIIRLSDGKWDAANCLPFADNTKNRPGLCGRFPFSFPKQPAGCPATTDYGDGEEFFSPSYPLSGNDGPVHCEYIMTARPGEAVLFDIVRLEANQCCDTLNLYHEGRLMNSWFGYQIEVEPPTWEYGPYEKYTMVWNATNPSGTRGFHVKVKSVPKEQFFEIQQKQSAEKKMKELANKIPKQSEDPVDVE